MRLGTRRNCWCFVVPRPRRFREGVSPADIAALYAEGRSTRELEAQTGLSRWVITAWCLRHGVSMRARDDALERQRYFSSLEEERAEATRCVWPHCSLDVDESSVLGRLCLTHDLEVGHADRRGCCWPPICYETVFGPGHLCGYHKRRANGEISG
jgi:hypothetical protein